MHSLKAPVKSSIFSTQIIRYKWSITVSEIYLCCPTESGEKDVNFVTTSYVERFVLSGVGVEERFPFSACWNFAVME